MAILKMEGAAMFNFVVSEANDWRSRDEVEVTNTGDEPMLAGTVLSAGSGDNPATGWASGAALGILGQSLAAGETAKRTIIARDAEVNGHMLAAGEATDAAVDTALSALGIVVRRNKGLVIDPVNQLGGLPEEEPEETP